ncbi:hypothetical protein FDB42_13645 [Clostridium botulinum]|nr:hypothetical protein [Clostridium botulinum]
MNKDYEIIKKYLLNNQWDIDLFEENFPFVKELPNIELSEDEFIIFTDGYLFTAEFHDEEKCWEYDSSRFYELTNEQDNFIKMREVDIPYYAIDFIENQAFESVEV